MVEKGLFGGPYIRFSRFLELALFLFTTGVVLGRARHDRIEILARLLVAPEREGEFADFLRHVGGERMQEYGREPESFVEFFMGTQLGRLGLTYPDSLLQVAKQKVPLTKEVEQEFSAFCLEGMAFGASFPELAEAIWRQTYEKRHSESWARARRAGLDIPEEEETIPLEETEQEVLLQVAAYAHDYCPEFIEPLGLHLGKG